MPAADCNHNATIGTTNRTLVVALRPRAVVTPATDVVEHAIAVRAIM